MSSLNLELSMGIIILESPNPFEEQKNLSHDLFIYKTAKGAHYQSKYENKETLE